MAVTVEPACDLRIGQVGVATLKLKRLDADDIRREMSAKVRSAPQLLSRAAVIVDLNAFSTLPGTNELKQLLTLLRETGVLPVGLAYGSPAIETLAREVSLPLFSRFRANYEHDAAQFEGSSSRPETTAEHRPPEPTTPAEEPAPASPSSVTARTHEGHVRSGQQIYARGQDLTIIGSVGAGAEVIADGNIHIYGALRGRALAGAAGDAKARVFCREFLAELVAVAGHYRVLDDAPVNLHGRPLQIRLDGERLLFEPI